jgi:hypothetical protein
LLWVAAADEGRAVDEVAADDRAEELVMAEEAGRADEVEARAEEVVTPEEEARVDEATEEALEVETAVVTGLAPDDLLISCGLSFRCRQLTQAGWVERPT